jgi:alpha-beta hydrolase superfamily lysophospholipase
MPNPFHWCIHRRRRLVILLVGAVVLLNLAAFFHARAFTHYAIGGPRTGPAQELGLWHKIKVIGTGVRLPRPENRYTPAASRLPYTTHTIAANGVTLEAWHIPADNPRGLAVLFHGYGGCKSNLLWEAVTLRKLGFSILLVDFRGSGGSSESITTIGALEADDVAAAVAYAQNRWPDQRLVLFGQSMGAAAVLRAVAGGAAADAILLECPFDRLLTTVSHRFELMGLPTVLLPRVLVFWGGVQNGFDALAHNPVEYAASVRCPVLVMHGAKDRLVHEKEAEDIFRALSGPKRWELFAEAGHESYCFKCQARWTSVVKEFVSEHLK